MYIYLEVVHLYLVFVCGWACVCASVICVQQWEGGLTILMYIKGEGLATSHTLMTLVSADVGYLQCLLQIDKQ